MHGGGRSCKVGGSPEVPFRLADDISRLAEHRTVALHEAVDVVGMQMRNRDDCHIGRRIARCCDTARQVSGSELPAFRPVAGVEEDEFGACVHQDRLNCPIIRSDGKKLAFIKDATSSAL